LFQGNILDRLCSHGHHSRGTQGLNSQPILFTSFAHSKTKQIIFIFAFSAYATNEVAGSPGKVWELLVDAAQRHPVDGNAGGSYLTMQSREGAIFFVINIVGNFGTVFLDNGTIPPNFFFFAGTADDPTYRLLQ
jgi:hypothetical protein